VSRERNPATGDVSLTDLVTGAQVAAELVEMPVDAVMLLRGE